MSAISYLDTYSSKETVNVYKSGLRKFLKAMYDTDDLSYVDRYVSEERNHESDINNFFTSIKDRPPKSIKLGLSTVRTFFVENRIQVDDVVWRRIRRRINGKGALSKDRPPTSTELKQILTHMDLKGRAFFLTLVSSGARDGEMLKLKLSDIDFNKTPVIVDLKADYTKSGERRYTFISDEAKAVLLEWLKCREAYIASSSFKVRGVLNSRGIKFTEKSATDQRVFPFEYPVIWSMWNNALKKTGLGAKDAGRYVLHPHTLRKFFRTELATQIPVDVVEALMGHEGYLTDSYRRYSLEQLADFYKQAMHAVTVFGDKSLSELEANMKSKSDELQTLVNSLSIDNLRMKQQLTDLTTKAEAWVIFQREWVQVYKWLWDAHAESKQPNAPKEVVDQLLGLEEIPLINETTN